MKRVAFAFLIGVIFPVVYTIAAAGMTGMFPAYFSLTMEMFGEEVPGPILAPTMFPIYFETWLWVNSFFGWGVFLDNIIFRFLIILLPNIALYWTLSYLVLFLLRFPKKAPRD